MDYLSFISRQKPIGFINLQYLKTTNRRMRWKPTNFSIAYFLVNAIRPLLLPDYFVHKFKLTKFLLIYLGDVGFFHELGLDFAKILEAVLNKKPVIFGSEYLEKDMLIFEELHGDIFDIAAEGLEQGEREDDIFHVDFFGCDFGEVDEEFFTIHFTEKGIEESLLIFSGEGFILDLASFFDDCKLVVNIFKVPCDFGQCLVAERPEALKEILRRQVIILIFF